MATEYTLPKGIQCRFDVVNVAVYQRQGQPKYAVYFDPRPVSIFYLGRIIKDYVTIVTIYEKDKVLASAKVTFDNPEVTAIELACVEAINNLYNEVLGKKSL